MIEAGDAIGAFEADTLSTFDSEQDWARSMRGAAGFTFVQAWPAVTDDDGAAIQAFWQREGAIPDANVAAERLKQVVLHARDDRGAVAGVCTAFPVTPPRFGQPMYYWRTFIGAAWRSTALVGSLLRRSCSILEDYARENDYPCIGILLELENARFSERGRKAVWVHPKFVYIGVSDRGLDTRAYYFPGVRLKPRPRPAAGARVG